MLFIFEIIFLIKSFENDQRPNLYNIDEIRDVIYKDFGEAVFSLQIKTLLSIINCTFLSNTGKNVEPGAISASGNGSIIIIRSTFENNTGTSEGGSIYLDIKVATITECLFTNNLCYTESTESKGGAIFIRSQTDYDQTIESCIFIENLAKTAGGSIFIDFSTYSYKSILISNCNFKESLSEQKGGALYLQYQNSVNENSGETIIVHNTFYSCLSANGGCIFLSDLSDTKSDEKTIKNCLFLKSNATNHGSAIYSEANYINIFNNSFSSCLAVGEGTFYLNAKQNLIEVYFLSNFIEDCVSNSGGFLSIQCEHEIDSNSLVSIDDCIFNNNVVESKGGAIYAIGDLGTSITKCRFNGTVARQHGGAIYAEKSPIKVDHCLFDQCIANTNEDSKGGAIYFRQIKGETEELCTFNNFSFCQSKFSGGAIYVYCNEDENLEPGDTDSILLVKIKNCIFFQCSSDVEGGAISSGEIKMGMMNGDNDMVIESCVFRNCDSGRGGALYFQDGTKDGDEETLIIGCSFYDCYATYESKEGYAIYCRSYLIHIENCQFRQHKRGTSVPTSCILYTQMNEAYVAPVIKSLIFEENAGVSCLIVKSIEPTTISNLTFIKISGNLPCINLDKWEILETLTIEYFYFKNIAEARCIISTTETETFSTIIENCLFVDNSIRNFTGGEYLSGCGSCILCQHKADVYVTSCHFTNNVAESNGGAIYAETESIEIDLCYFTLCSAAPLGRDGHGGAVYLNQTSASGREYFNLNCFISCNASYSGGGLFVYCRDIHNARSTREDDNMEYAVSVINCNFTDCSSTVEGGAISSGLYNEETKGMEGDNDLQISSCNFIRCRSGKGGALFFQDGTKDGDEETVITGCKFFECYANGDDHEGYAISCRSYRIKIGDIGNIDSICEFHNHQPDASHVQKTKDCIVYVESNEEEVTPDIQGLIFDNILNVPCLTVKTFHEVTISGLQFNNIVGHPCINLNDWSSNNNIMNIENSIFTNIHNSRCIMSTKASDISVVRITQCQFINVTLESNSEGEEKKHNCGGSIYCERSSSVEIRNCNFTNNEASVGGGAIYAETDSIDIQLNRFTNCSVPGDEMENIGYGGAVFLEQTSDSKDGAEFITNNIFIKCESKTSGGGIFIICRDEEHKMRSKRTTKADGEETNDHVIIISESQFTDCKSGEEGGAVCSGYLFKDLETGKEGILGDNDMKIHGCYFTRCESKKGGALYFQDGTKEGDEETVIYDCHFYECYANGEETQEGYAISCRSYKITITNCDFHNHQPPGNIPSISISRCIVYAETNEDLVRPNIENLTFEDNKDVSCLVVKSYTEFTIERLQFNNISGEPCINLDEWKAKSSLTIRSSTFNNIHNSRCIVMTRNGAEFTGYINDCIFNNINIDDLNQEDKYAIGSGSCIYSSFEAKLAVTSCNFTSNTATTNGGSIYAETESIDISSNIFYNCSVKGGTNNGGRGYGGAVYLHQTQNSNINGELIMHNIFIKCYAITSGGGLFVICRDEEEHPSTKRTTRSNINNKEQTYTIIIDTNNFTECISGLEGGAISSGMMIQDENGKDHYVLGSNDMEVTNCFFTRCESKKGGALYFQDGTKEGDEETLIQDCHFYECKAYGDDGEGYAISASSYYVSLHDCSFKQHEGLDNQKHNIIYIMMNEENTPNIFSCTFDQNINVSCLVLKTISSVTVKDFNITNQYGNSPCINFNQWEISHGIGTLEGFKFKNIIDARCIFMSENTLSASIHNCTFDNATLIDNDNDLSGACILCLNNGNISISESKFIGANANGNGGAIAAESKSIEINDCIFIHCSVYGISDNRGNGGAIFINSSTHYGQETLNRNLFDDCTASNLGGAIFVHGKDAEFSKKLLENDNGEFAVKLFMCNFTRCSSINKGGAVTCGYNFEVEEFGSGDNDLEFTNCLFLECESGSGGALYFQLGSKDGDEDSRIESCTFINCFAKEGEGCAISSRAYRTYIINCTFIGHNKVASDEISTYIVYAEINDDDSLGLKLKNNTFEGNSQVTSLKFKISNVNHLTLYNFKFRNYHSNQASSSSSSSCIDLDDWESSATIFFEEFEFTDITNLRCISGTRAKFVAQIVKSNFTNISYHTRNSGDKCGASIYYSKEGSLTKQEITIEECIFRNNTANGQGGAIYAHAEVASIKSNKFYNCQTISEDENDFGGAIYLDAQSIDSQEYLLGNIFENCSSTNNGGAFFAYCIYKEEGGGSRSLRESDDFRYSILIKNCNFTRCRSKKQGGAVSSGVVFDDFKSGDNDLIFQKCYFTECESEIGGALYFQDGSKEGDEQTYIRDCTFINCYASGEKHEGYAIHCRSYQIFIENNTFIQHKRGSNVKTSCIVYVETNEADVTPSIQSLRFEDNVGISSLVIKTLKPITIEGLIFNNIQDQLPCINLDNWEIGDELIIANSTFSNILNARCIVTLTEVETFSTIVKGCNFSKNSNNKDANTTYLTGCGSSILCINRGRLNVSECNFIENVAESNGGAIYADADCIQIDCCSFSSCSSAIKDEDRIGGAVCLIGEISNAKQEIIDCIFINCSCSSNGGALYINCNCSQNIDINNCTFINCHSKKEGGALFSEPINGRNDFNLHNCRFKGCSSDTSGGAVSISTKHHAFIDSCSFESNVANNGNGGAIYTNPISKVILEICIIERCSFVSNKAVDGFAVSIEGNGNNTKINITDNSFINNYNKATIEISYIIFLETCCVSGTGVLSSNTFSNQENGRNISVNEFSCYYWERYTSLFSPSVYFTNSNPYSESSKFSESSYFSNSEQFTNSLHFTPSETFQYVYEIYGYCGDGVKYAIYSNQLVISGAGEIYNYSIDSRSPWHEHTQSFKFLTIKEGITSIGSYAFKSCDLMESATIPSSVTSIHPHAFHNCSNLRSIQIPENVTKISESCFDGCFSLMTVVALGPITNISDKAFSGCSSLENFKFASNSFSVRSSDPIVFPTTLENIGASSFSGCEKIESVEIPRSVKSIKRDTFLNCAMLRSVSLHSEIKSIEEQAFCNCSSLNEISLPSDLELLEKRAFNYCSSLQSIEIPQGITVIEEGLFSKCTNLKSIKILGNVTSIGSYAFSNCEMLKSIDIPSSVTEIGVSAFEICYSLASITIPINVTTIEESCFNNCNDLASVTFLGNLTTINTRAFATCTSLIEITLPESATYLGSNAFYFCQGLQSFVIPKNVDFIGEFCFYRCSLLSSVTFEGLTNPSHGDSILKDTNVAKVIVPDDYNDNNFCGYSIGYVLTKSLEFTISDVFTPSNLLAPTATPTATIAGITLTHSMSYIESFVSVRSVTFSVSYISSKSYSYVLFADGQYSMTFTNVIVYRYFPYVIYYLSPTYIRTEFLLEMNIRKKMISQEQLIGVVCGSVAAFFLVLALIIVIIRRKNQVYVDINEVDMYSSESSYEEIIQDKPQEPVELFTHFGI